MRYDLTLQQVAAVRMMLSDQFEEDERGWIDLLEGETDLFELSRRILDRIEADEGAKAELAEQLDCRRIRQARCDKRIKAQREALGALMECAGLDKLTLPEATVSLRKNGPKAIVTNEAELPDEFCTFTRKPNMAAIREAETLPAGVSLDNGGISITVRRK